VKIDWKDAFERLLFRIRADGIGEGECPPRLAPKGICSVSLNCNECWLAWWEENKDY
jgi:hypothetical protein